MDGFGIDPPSDARKLFVNLLPSRKSPPTPRRGRCCIFIDPSGITGESSFGRGCTARSTGDVCLSFTMWSASSGLPTTTVLEALSFSVSRKARAFTDKKRGFCAISERNCSMWPSKFLLPNCTHRVSPVRQPPLTFLRSPPSVTSLADRRSPCNFPEPKFTPPSSPLRHSARSFPCLSARSTARSAARRDDDALASAGTLLMSSEMELFESSVRQHLVGVFLATAFGFAARAPRLGSRRGAVLIGDKSTSPNRPATEPPSPQRQADDTTDRRRGMKTDEGVSV